MNTKMISLVLSIVMCIFAFAGCQSSELRAYSDEKPEETDAGTEAAKVRDYTPAFESYAPDEVMLTVNGIDVTWEELFYWMVYDVSSIENYFGEITDWDAACAFDETKTYREYVTTNALETVKHYCALMTKAEDASVTLSDEDKAALEERWQSNVTNYGGGDENAFIEYLSASFLSKGLYNHINEVSALYQKLLEEIYGPTGEKLSEKEVVDKANEMGYVYAKHILFKTTDEANAALPEDQVAEKKANAEDVLAQLQAISDPAALEAKFDELTKEYTDDTGIEFYPEGYIYLPGTMVEEFENAAKELGEYELSGLVETSYGYHIILRLPLKTDVPVEVKSETEKNNLPYFVAQDLFGKQTKVWADESKVEMKEAYNKLDIAEVFAKTVTKDK